MWLGHYNWHSWLRQLISAHCLGRRQRSQSLVDQTLVSHRWSMRWQITNNSLVCQTRRAVRNWSTCLPCRMAALLLTCLVTVTPQCLVELSRAGKRWSRDIFSIVKNSSRLRFGWWWNWSDQTWCTDVGVVTCQWCAAHCCRNKARQSEIVKEGDAQERSCGRLHAWSRRHRVGECKQRCRNWTPTLTRK